MPIYRTLVSLVLSALAISSYAADGPVKLDEGLASFFAGQWTGAGEFGNGKKIEAEASFQRELDGQWLQYRHTDKAPNVYKALGLWGVETASHKLVMTLNDNFGGARRFESDGWADGKVVFVKVGVPVSPTVRQERFTFERQSPERFRMTYEWSPDAATWKLGDYLVFERQH